jgi:hypothetical protein
MYADAHERLRSHALSSSCSRFTRSGGQQVLAHGIQAEFVVAQTGDRDILGRPGLVRQPGSVRISKMHRGVAPIVGRDQIQLQARDAAVDQQFFAAIRPPLA